MKKFCALVTAVLMLFVPAVLWAAASPEPTEKTMKREIKIGKKGQKVIEEHIPRVFDPDEEARLALIADRLTPYLQRKFNYTVRILDVKQPNAFSLPGGMTYFTTGMLKFLKSDDEIAAVMSHEFIHADRAHGIVQAKRNNRLSLLTIAGLIAATQAGGESSGGIATMAMGLQTAISNSYGIELEKEADSMGIEVLRRAGYNPAAMLTMMERMRVEKLKRAQYQLGIFQTHPEEEERVEAALKYLHDKGINIRRKEVVNLLKVKACTSFGYKQVTIDDEPIVSVPESEEVSRLFEELAERLDNTLELELAPYDVKVIEENTGGNTLMIGRMRILTEAERLEGMPTLAELRDLIIKAVNRARSDNMMTDYFR